MIVAQFVPGSMDVVASSRAANKEIVLECLGEVHFGPPYYALWIRVLGRDRFFGPGRDVVHGSTCELSPDGRFLILERWRGLGAPDNTAVALDLFESREVVVAQLGNGFLRQVKFEPGLDRLGSSVCVIHYDVFDGSVWTSREMQIDKLSELGDWHPLTWWREEEK